MLWFCLNSILYRENQGVWNRRDAVRPTIWLYMLCRRYFIWIRNICLMYNYRVYNNIFWMFLTQMEYRLQIMYNHMVGFGVSCISLVYSILISENLLFALVLIFSSASVQPHLCSRRIKRILIHQSTSIHPLFFSEVYFTKNNKWLP